MTTDTTNASHRFVSFGRRLVNVDRSVLRLFSACVLGYRRNRLHALGVSFADALLGFLMAARFRFRGGSGQAQHLPVPGDVALRVHRGYKVFDFDNSVVSKVFDAATPQADADAELQACIDASAVKAAPRFVASDPDGRWYTEEYIAGKHGTQTAKALNGDFGGYFDDVAECLIDLAGAGPRNTVDVAAYLEELTAPELLAAWQADAEARDTAAEVGKYQARLKRWLIANMPDKPLTLVWTHGDFSLVNVIISKRRFRVIDWEGLRPGNVHSDVINFVFVEKYYRRAQGDIVDPMHVFVSRYDVALRSRLAELKVASKPGFQCAVRLYYLERLQCPARAGCDGEPRQRDAQIDENVQDVRQQRRTGRAAGLLTWASLDMRGNSAGR